jgi:formylglycine-generating enzyme required for sulfatase activity
MKASCLLSAGLVIIAATACAHPARSTVPTKTSRVDRAGIRQVWVPPGSFTMGTDDATLAAIREQAPPKWVAKELASERPAHVVRLTAGYWIDAHEVTNAAYRAFVDDGGYERRAHWSDAGWAWLATQERAALPASCPGTEPDQPRRCITWYEAEAYAAWRGGRLPTEAEWEFAARGPDSRIYPWGNAFDPARCNVVDSAGPTPVGKYPDGVSWVGAFDMAGNSMEWVADWLDVDYYARSTVDDPKGPATGTIKVEKGGWWGANPFVARSAYRHYEDPPGYADKHIGVRVVTP